MKLKQIGIVMVVVTMIAVIGMSFWLISNKKKPASHLEGIVYRPTETLDGSEDIKLLQNHQINMMPRVESFQVIKAVKQLEDISLYTTPNSGQTLNGLFFNVRKAPFDDVVFREAMASIVDRDQISETLLKGLVAPCEFYVPPLSEKWVNREAIGTPFDSIKARQLLDEAGYTYIADLKTRINPKTQEPIALTILSPTREDNEILWNIAYSATYYINAIGIEATHLALPTYLLLENAIQTRDFDVLVQEVTLTQAPFELYTLFHSSQDQPYTKAYSGIQDGLLDQSLEKLWFGSSEAVVQKAAKEAQSRLATLQVFVPVCTTLSYSAVANNWQGIVNIPGIGAANFWTYQSIFSNEKDKNTLIQSARGGFVTLNPLLATKFSEWDVLKKIYSPLLYLDPVSLEEVPVLAESWTVSDWQTSEGTLGMQVTFKLKPEIVWQDGVPFTANDIKFGIDYMKTNEVTAFKETMDIIDHVIAVDAQTVEIYFNESGYRHLYEVAWLTFLPEHIWQSVADYQVFEPWKEENPNNPELTKLVGQGTFVYERGELKDGVTLKWQSQERANEKK